MEFAKRTWVQIKDQSGAMPANTKLTIAALVVILALVFSLVFLYTSRHEYLPVSGFYDVQDEAAVLQALDAAGVETRTKNGTLQIAAPDRARAIGAISQAGLLRGDSAAAFQEMFASVNPWMSSAQWDDQYTFEASRELSAMIRSFPGVAEVRVMLPRPQRTRFAERYAEPSAAVQVTSANGAGGKALANAIASLVSGSVPGLKPANVEVVIDGLPVDVRDADTLMPTDLMDAEIAFERHKQRVISGHLGQYIPGVSVAVDAHLDAMRRERRTEQAFGDAALASEFSRESSTTEPATQGEPGLRANTGTTIAGSAATGAGTTQEERESTFSDAPLTRRSEQDIAGGHAQRINVSVLVPRTYYLALWKADNPDSEEGPDGATLAAYAQDINDNQIIPIIKPLTLAEGEGVSIGTDDSEIVVQMVADASVLDFGDNAVATAGIAGFSFKELGYYGSTGVGVLALLGLAFFTLRKVNVTEELPALEDLAGVPQTLPTDEDLIGEVEEGDGEMTGVIIDDGDLKTRKIAEQINELVASNPEEATALLNKWVEDDMY